MKKLLVGIFLLSLPLLQAQQPQSWIRINNLGYLPESTKVAVFVSQENQPLSEFEIVDVRTHKTVFKGNIASEYRDFGPFAYSARLNFSQFNSTGRYKLKAHGIESPEFSIDWDVYDHTADFLLKYMRQQRCGYNPFFADSCHVNDGFIVYHPTKTGQRLDVTGGWHDATDYLQYTATSANAVYQLLFSFKEYPKVFTDTHKANGLPGPNGIPDVIDEAKFGMDWLKKMNPSDQEYYNQIADDRDHAGYRLPTQDSVVYDSTQLGRPVYLASAEKQGLLKYKNRSTGAANTAGKFASAFAMGAQVLPDFYPNYTQDLKLRAIKAFAYGFAHPGVSQTAPCKGPYFYEEDNWVDDMELAGATLYQLDPNPEFQQAAKEYANREPLSPWIGKDSVNHYQYYPFLNAGHYALASTQLQKDRAQSIAYYKKGLAKIQERGIKNPFMIGTPLVWCSNNFVAAAVTQAQLYQKLSGDQQFHEMEAALRDWLFGCNPWGTTMIVGLPHHGDAPTKPHSSLYHLADYQTYGGLVDGPVYGSIYNSLIGIQLLETDNYAPFQSDFGVYHDDVGDYSTNEPTMDGTASLIYYLASLENQARTKGAQKVHGQYDADGALVRGNREKKQLSLVFTGDAYADGAQTIVKVLRKHQVKASFFLTGNFYAQPNYKDLIQTLKADGHYLGAHSDQHLLYNDWSKDKKRLVDYNTFTNDLKANYQKMADFGISKSDAPYFLPPYEWHDDHITQWAYQMDLRLINYTKGTLSHADYTTPNMDNYRSSETIYQSIIKEEKANGLNGYLLLSHIGTHPDRTDKFYDQLDRLIQYLKQKGYDLVSLNENLGKLHR